MKNHVVSRMVLKPYWAFIITLLIVMSCSTEPESASPLSFYAPEENVFPSQDFPNISDYITVIGGSDRDLLNSVIQSPDDGYILAGNTSSHDGDFEGIGREFRYDEYDAFLMKINSNKEIEWVRTYGGSDRDTFEHILKNDDGYTVIGSSTSDDGDFGDHSLFRADIDLDGRIRSVHSIDESLQQNILQRQVQQLENGNYVSVGSSSYYTEFLTIFDKEFNPLTTFDFGNGEVHAIGMVQDSNDGFVVSGNTKSKEGVFEGMHDDLRSGHSNAFIGKFNQVGELEWINSYGGLETDEVHSLIQTRNGNYLIAGVNQTNDGDFEGMGGEFQRGINQIFLIKIDPDGKTIWKKTYGGSGGDNKVLSIHQTNDDQLVMTGVTSDANLKEIDNSITYAFVFMAKMNVEGEDMQIEGYNYDYQIPSHDLWSHASDSRLIMIGNSHSLEIYFLDFELD